VRDSAPAMPIPTRSFAFNRFTPQQPWLLSQQPRTGRFALIYLIPLALNRYALAHFRFTVSHSWHRALERRSRKGRVQWERMQQLIRRWLPRPISAILIPRAVCASPPEARAGCGNPLVRICTGGTEQSSNPYPYRDPTPPAALAALPFGTLL
jgi:hypothetical protein